MKGLTALFAGITSFFRNLIQKRRVEQDLDEEIRAYLLLKTDENMSRGMSAETAARAAKAEFGGIERVKEEVRAVRVGIWLEQVLQDLRFGVRVLWKSPGFSSAAAILIAVVVGCNITIYSMFHTFLTKPAPAIYGEGIVSLQSAMNSQAFSYSDYLALTAQSATVHSMTAFFGKEFSLSVGTGSYAIPGSVVAENYFGTLGVVLFAGDTFENSARGMNVGEIPVVISYRVWQEHFQSSPEAIGKTIYLDGHVARITGIAPRLFQGPYLGYPEDAWAPVVPYFRATGTESQLDGAATSVMVLGILANGSTSKEALAELSVVVKHLPRIGTTEVVDDRKITIAPYSAVGSGSQAENMRRFLSIFAVATLLTLLLVSSNVANLMLGRSVVRQRETAIRQSFGASRLRIIRMLIAEGLAIALVAWVTACVFSYWTVKGIARLLASVEVNGLGMRFNYFNMDFSPDRRVLVYAMLLAFICMLAFTVGPALNAWNRAPLPDLKAGEQSIARGRSKFSSALVIAQIAFAVVLLVSAGLLYKSIAITNEGDIGFNPDGLLLMTVNPALAGAQRSPTLAVYEAIRTRFLAVPGIQGVSYGRAVPPASSGHLIVAGSDSQKSQSTSFSYVGPGYLAALGLSPLSGRDFSSNEDDRVPVGAIINKALAEQLWPHQQAVGQLMRFGTAGKSAEIIGVAPNLFERLNTSQSNYVLFSEQQANSVIGAAVARDVGDVTYYVRYSGSVDTIGPALGVALREADSRVPIVYMRTMDTQLSSMKAARLALTTAILIFSLGSLFIAVMGQYAVVTFNLKRRTREFGVRVAIGASVQQIVTSVMGEGLMLTVLGLVCGSILSVIVGLVFRSLLYGVTLADPEMYVGILMLLGVASLLACYFPARRASRVDPLVALRHD